MRRHKKGAEKMRGAILRKIAVSRRIAQLSKADQKLVQTLFVRYDSLEYATIMPLYVMMMSTIILPLFYAMWLTKLYGITTIMAGICSGLIWAALCAVIWFGSVQPRRKRHKRAIQEVVEKGDEGRRAFETLRRLDPNMARNCGKIIA